MTPDCSFKTQNHKKHSFLEIKQQWTWTFMLQALSFTQSPIKQVKQDTQNKNWEQNNFYIMVTQVSKVLTDHISISSEVESCIMLA